MMDKARRLPLFVGWTAWRSLRVETVAQIALLIPFLVAVPIALLFGFSLSSPDSFFNILIMAICFGVMLLPVFIRWHDIMLIASWNLPVFVFFLPGQPQLWMLMVFVSLVISFVSGGLSQNINPNALRTRTQIMKPVGWSLIALAGVVLTTAFIRGGIGGRAFGSEIYGAKKYLPILFAVVGFFALSRINIASDQRRKVILLFFGGYLLLTISNLAYMAGPSFYWLYYIFPFVYALPQVESDINANGFARFSGIAFAMTGVFCYMLARYGIKNIMRIKHLPRLLVFLIAIGLATFGGYRSLLVLFAFIFIFQFYLEGLFSTHLFPLFAVIGALLLGVGILFVNKMPYSVQRTFSFLPITVDPVVREDARASTEWRFGMWSVLWDEIPKYLVVGKGYRIDPAELALFDWARATHRGHFDDYEEVIAVGNYHSGPFSVLLSFGIMGVTAVLWFWRAGLRMLCSNITRGNPELRLINITLFSCFAARVVFFLFIYGELSTDLPIFCGLLGISAILNKP